MRSYISKRRGFTLIELLVVLSIIGLLCALIIASLSGARDNADDATAKNNLNKVKVALEVYQNQYGGYPISVPIAPNSDGSNNVCCATGDQCTFAGVLIHACAATFVKNPSEQKYADIHKNKLLAALYTSTSRVFKLVTPSYPTGALFSADVQYFCFSVYTLPSGDKICVKGMSYVTLPLHSGIFSQTSDKILVTAIDSQQSNISSGSSGSSNSSSGSSGSSVSSSVSSVAPAPLRIPFDKYGCISMKNAPAYNPLLEQDIYDDALQDYGCVAVVKQVTGCMDPSARDYIPGVNVAGKCTYNITDCTDPTIGGYNPKANINDPVNCKVGCTDPKATNYNVTNKYDRKPSLCTYSTKQYGE